MNQHPKARGVWITTDIIKLIDATMMGITFHPNMKGSHPDYTAKDIRNMLVDLAYEMTQIKTHGHTPSELVEIIRELRAELLNMVEKFEGAHIIECDDFSTSSAHSALTKTEDFR